MIFKLTLQQSDTLGAVASTLCVVHCIATPFLFIIHTCAVGGCKTAPLWWKNLDYIFLLISFLAVLNSVKNTSKKFMKPVLWSSWFALFFLILNEKIQLVVVSEMITYATALSLSLLHIYNMKYCQCKTSKCCTQHG